MNPEFIINGEGHGGIASLLLANNMDTGVLRPFIDPTTGRSYVTVNRGGKEEVMVANANATLTKDEWLSLDETVIRVARENLVAWGDLQRAGLRYNVPNGMGTTVLQYQTMSDVNGAIISMDGLRQSDRDRPVVDLRNLPLPIIHKDVSYSMREIATSRRSGMPLDTTSVELATRKVVEEAEKLLFGSSTYPSYGGGTIYGYTNFPQRLTKTLTNPTTSGWTPQTLVNELLDMKQLSINAFYRGPWNVYLGTAWSRYLDDDYNENYTGETLRSRIGKIDRINKIETADYLTGYQIVMVQMTSDVVQAVTGMEVQAVQWESHGGMQWNAKIMAIYVPRLRSDFNSRTGIIHGNV